MSLMRVSVYNRQQTLKLSRSADESASVLEMSLHCEAIYFCFFFSFIVVWLIIDMPPIFSFLSKKCWNLEG